MYLKTKAIKCPECGIIIQTASTSGKTECSHCATPLLYRIQNDPPKYFIRSLLDIKDTSQILLKTLRHFLIAKDFISRSRIISRRLYYIPFIYTTGYRCGEHIIEGQDKITEEKTKDTRVLISPFRHIRAAVSLESWGVSEIDPLRVIKNGILPSPLTEKERDDNAIFLRPDISYLKEEEITRDFMTCNRNISSEIILDHSIILYYPVIRVLLQYRQNTYHFLIDGISGEIVYGTAPEAERNRFLPMVFSALFIAWLSAGLLNLIIRAIIINIALGGFIFLSVFLFFIILVGIFIYIAWIFYRNYGEIVIRWGKVEINKLNLPDRPAIERLLRPLFRIVEQMTINRRT